MGKVWTKKPPVGTPLDLSNPLVKGLIFFAPLNETSGDGIDLITGTRGFDNSSGTSTLSRAVDQFGLHVDMEMGASADNNGLQFPEHPTWDLGGTKEITLITHYKKEDEIGANGSSILSKLDVGFANGVELRLASNSLARMRVNATNFQVTIPSASNVNAYMAGVLDGSNGKMLYRNTPTGGITHRNDQAFTADIGATATTALSIGQHIDNARALDGKIYWGGMWNRALTEEQIVSLWDNPWQIFEPRRQFAHTDVPKNINIVPTGSPPNPLATSLLRAFFFDPRNGTGRDAAQRGEKATPDAGVTVLSPFGVDIPRTANIDVEVDSDRGRAFEFQKEANDHDTSMFFHFRFDGIESADEFTLSGNSSDGNIAVYTLDQSDGGITEDGADHTILVTTSRGDGLHLYLDGNLIGSDLIFTNENNQNCHLVRYQSNINTWEVRTYSNATPANLKNIRIGGTHQTATDDQWDGPIYAALYWHEKLNATDAKWLHHNYRTLLDDLQVRHFDAPVPEALPELVVVEPEVTSMPMRPLV